MTLSTLLTVDIVEDDKRISERSSQNAEFLRVVEFYCCGKIKIKDMVVEEQI